MTRADITPAATASPRKPDPLLQPLTIRHLTLRNRIMSSSHASTMDDGGMPAARYQAYHAEKARGGLALTMFGGSTMATTIRAGAAVSSTRRPTRSSRISRNSRRRSTGSARR